MIGIVGAFHRRPSLPGHRDQHRHRHLFCHYSLDDRRRDPSGADSRRQTGLIRVYHHTVRARRGPAIASQ
ncbi:hypothetical protein JOH52_000590 [Sinorhizobium meliloti]|nr:hypothetical protein [Sinorhizobium meliloti]